MRIKVLMMSCVALAGMAGCKKGGGGGGGWFVGERGLMSNVDQAGHLGEGYDLGASETLNAIACRYADEAWVVGNSGTLLYTSDAGGSWDAHDLGTTANLRALATQDAGPVFIAGDGVFLTATPEYATGAAQWTQLSDGATSFRSLAAAQAGSTVLAVGDDGSIWSYADGRLVQRTTIDGAHAVAVSPDGTQAVVAGAGLSRSSDGGLTWHPVSPAGGPSSSDRIDAQLDSVRINDVGDIVAVGAGGMVARVDIDNRVLTQTVGTANLRALHVLGGYSATGYAAGDGGQTWMTHDGGWTWVPGPNVGANVLSVDEIGDGHN